MTEKLYYIDSHMRRFDAVVTSCEPDGERFCVTLDRTAFFPEGGGQAADRGLINGVPVLDVQEDGDEVAHFLSNSLPVGAEVEGVLDWDFRFQNMQSHSGEHIVSGVIHNMFGFDNVGFHMGADGMIVDFDGYISPEELAAVELSANGIIYENRAVTARFPSPEELSVMTYRSKLSLTENVRIVTIDGVDDCACCAPHVKFTGEVGLIKIFESSRRKNGVRIRMLAGKEALRDYELKQSSVAAISALLSAKQENISDAVERLIAERDALSYELGGARRAEIAYLAEASKPSDFGNLVFFKPGYGSDELRLLVNSALNRASGIVAAFSGSDETGHSYVMASESVNMREFLKSFNLTFEGRGGGSERMVQGSVKAAEEKLSEYFDRYLAG